MSDNNEVKKSPGDKAEMKKKAYFWSIPVWMLLVGAWSLWERREVLETNAILYYLCGIGIVAGTLLVGSWAYSKTR